MNKIVAFRSGTSVMVRFDNSSRTLPHQKEEEAIETFKKVMAIKANPTPKGIEELRTLIDPEYKFKENEYVERDRNGNFYLVGVNAPLPRLLVEKVKEYIDADIDLTPLINFWKLLVLNPDRRVRDSLYDFAAHFGFPITDMGYFIAYKSVYFAGKKHEQLALQAASKYVYLRAEGENPDDYLMLRVNGKIRIIKKDEKDEMLKDLVEVKRNYLTMKDVLELTDAQKASLLFDDNGDPYREEVVTPEVHELGTITEMFKNLPSLFDNESEESFTDCHTQTMDIHMGVPIKMAREECDADPNRTCSTGLHVGTPQYVKDFGASSKKYILACLVNPMHVVAVPRDYNGQKMRTCEYLPYAVCETDDHGNLKEINTKYFEEDYVSYEVSELEEMLKQINEKPQDEQDENMVQQIRNRLIQIS